MSAPDWQTLVQIAIDLTRSLVARDRYQRLLEAVRSMIPCDATALLALRGDELVPLAIHGLSPSVLGMRFPLIQHPRLAAIARSNRPVRFPAASRLPDPFDGLVDAAPGSLGDVHDCLGCPLVVDGAVVGALTADALATDAFDGLDSQLLVGLGALAGAALQTTRLVETIEDLAEQRGRVVRELTRGEPEGSQLLGVSAGIEMVRHEIETVANSDLTVLILGETGVGKEIAARAVHASSPRRDAPLIYVNCAALPESVVESELFGHVRGAFTGATANRPGKLEVADTGTLFLDEIGELPLVVQPVLLRALQEGEIQRVGSDQPLRVDVRIIAATNRDLAAEVAAGRFRADLYHRLAVYPVTVPPLRERREDIAVLAGYFLDRYRARLGVGRVLLTPAASEALTAAPWPGNARELDHVLARAVLRAGNRSDRSDTLYIRPGDLDLAQTAADAPTRAAALCDEVVRGERSLRDAVDELKRTVVQRALADSDGNWAAAARLLGMHRGNLHHLAQRLGIRAAR